LKKQILLTFYILVSTVLLSTVEVFAYADLEQTSTMSVQETASLTKTTNNETNSIDPKTGIHPGLNASFQFELNSTNTYDILLYSKIPVSTDTEASAYTNNGNLIFVNSTIAPTAAAIENARIEGDDNPNVIVYPITISVSPSMEYTYDSAKSIDNIVGSYVVTPGEVKTGSITQSVGVNPVGKTFSLGGDQAGSYKSTVYVTAVTK